MRERWPDRWRDLLAHEDIGAARRASRGTAYQRSNRVSQLRVAPGTITGHVHGSRTTPYPVRVGVPTLPVAAWDLLVGALAAEVRHSARLLAGEVSEDLEDPLAAAGFALFPDPAQVTFDCPCADPSPRCAHALAVWEATAAAMAEDPFVLLLLRGRGRQRLLADVAGARRGGTGRDGRLRLDELQPAGWARAPVPLDDVVVPPGHPPPTPAAPLRLLGDPPGWTGGVSAGDVLEPLINDAARWAGEVEGDDTHGNL